MSEVGQPQHLSKAALIAMSCIVVALLLVAIYANWQNAHRDKIESVTVTRFTLSPSPSPSATSAP
jgi:hypothetical protein